MATRRRPTLILSLAAVLLGAACCHAADVSKDTGQVLVAPEGYALVHRLPKPDFKPTVAYQWVDTLLEAYPCDKPEGGIDDFMWFGAKPMFDRAGFVEVARRRPTRPVMRRALRAAGDRPG